MIKEQKLLELIYKCNKTKWFFDEDIVQDFIMKSNIKLEQINKNPESYLRRSIYRFKIRSEKKEKKCLSFDEELMSQENINDEYELDKINIEEYPVLYYTMKGYSNKDIMELTRYKSKQSLSNRKKREIENFKKEINK